MCEFRFETKRLAIRDMTMDDCDIVAKAWGSFEVGKYLSDPYYKNGDELRNAFKNGELVNHENWTEDFYFVAVDKTKKEIIGTACTWKIENDIWGIGYTIIHQRYWNQGLGAELIQGLEKFIKSNGGGYISAEIAKENIGSLKACYKNGFEDYRETSFQKSGTNIVYDALELRKRIV